MGRNKTIRTMYNDIIKAAKLMSKIDQKKLDTDIQNAIKEAAQEVLIKHFKAALDNNNWEGDTCKLNGKKTYLPEVEAMLEFSAQKDEQIKELVEALENIIDDIEPYSSTCNDWETSDFLDGIIFWKSVPSDRRIIECIKLIRKHKQAR